MLKVANQVRPKSLVIVAALVNAALEMGLFKTIHGDMLITSALDGEHKRNSAHYSGLAVDMRTKNFPGVKEKHEFAFRVKQRLGERYDVILEDLGGPNEHLHVELDPSHARAGEPLEVPRVVKRTAAARA